MAGGFLIETYFMLLLYLAFGFAGFEQLQAPLARMSVAILLPWLLIDGFMIARRRILGDFSALWRLSPYATVMLMLGLIVSRVVLF